MGAQVISSRAKIRHYLADMLKEKVDVGGRVFINRAKSATFIEELPAINITFSDEENKVIVGSEFFPQYYQRNASIIITIAAEEIIAVDDELNTSRKGEDFADYLADQIESALGDDWNLSKRHHDFEENNPEKTGLTFGHQITGSSLYEVEVDSERKIIAMDIRVTFPYEKKARPIKRYGYFESYLADIVRVGATDETVDPVLVSAEGDL